MSGAGSTPEVVPAAKPEPEWVRRVVKYFGRHLETGSYQVHVVEGNVKKVSINLTFGEDEAAKLL
jgi:hypothetical protein